MPVSVTRRDDEYCVTEPDGTIVPGGCHELRTDAEEHAAAINANVEKQSLVERISKGLPQVISSYINLLMKDMGHREPRASSNFLVFKQADGKWRWLGVYSNKFLDDDYPADILSEGAHKRYVHRVKSGQLPWPVLRISHIKANVGTTDFLAYDDSGFVIASGLIQEKYAIALKNSGVDLAMSHGMIFLARDKAEPHVIVDYVSEELSVLSRRRAANKLTAFGFTKNQEEETMISEQDMKELKELVGDELANELVAQVKSMGELAGELKLAYKSLSANTTEITFEDGNSGSYSVILEESGAVEEAEKDAKGSSEDVAAAEDAPTSAKEGDMEEEEEEDPEEPKELAETSDLIDAAEAVEDAEEEEELMEAVSEIVDAEPEKQEEEEEEDMAPGEDPAPEMEDQPADEQLAMVMDALVVMQETMVVMQEQLAALMGKEEAPVEDSAEEDDMEEEEEKEEAEEENPLKGLQVPEEDDEEVEFKSMLRNFIEAGTAVSVIGKPETRLHGNARLAKAGPVETDPEEGAEKSAPFWSGW